MLVNGKFIATDLQLARVAGLASPHEAPILHAVMETAWDNRVSNMRVSKRALMAELMAIKKKHPTNIWLISVISYLNE